MSLSPYTLGGASNAPSTGTTLSFTLTHAVAAGDTLVVAAGSDAAGDAPIIGLTDSQGQTWTLLSADTTQTDLQSVYVCYNAKAMTTSDTITATYTGAGGSHTILGRGCAGIWTAGAVDVTISNSNAGSTSPSSGASGTLKQSSEWAVAFLINGSGGGSPTTWTGGFTAALTEHATSNQYHTVADQVTTATTALTAGATVVSTKWSMILVSFRAGPYVAGSNTFSSGTTSTAVTASANVASGDAVHVVCGSGTSGVAPSSVTDSASQTYTLVASESLSNMQVYVYEKLNSAALTSGTSTFTVTWNNTSGAKYVMAVGCNGIATSSAFDQSAGAVGSSTSPSSGTTSALAQAGEVGLGVIVGGSLSGSVTLASDWVQLGSTLHSGIYMAVGTKAFTTTSGASVSGSLGTSAAWGALVSTFIPGAGGSGGGGGGFAVTTTSPLPAATVGQPYSDTLATANGVAPITWAVTSGAVPTGMSLSTGVSSGGSSAIAHVMAVGGPNGSPGMNFSDWQTANSTIGPLTGAKIFYGELPSSWSVVGSNSTAAPSGTSPQQIANAGGVPIVCWNGPGGIQQSSAATITTFLKSIPAGQTVVFCWQGEPENPTSGFTSGKQYTDGFQATAAIIHGFGNPNLLTMHCGTWGQYGPSGRAYDGSYLPNGTSTDIYGLDIYQHQAGGSLNGATSWSSNGLSNNAFWTRFVTLVKPLASPLGRAFALSEYGVDLNTGTASARNARIQADYAYLQGAFGPGGSVTTVPLFCWLYWWHDMANANNDYKFTDSATESTWKGIAAGSTSSGGSSTGGVLSGTCNAAATYTFTAQATDSASHTASASLSITVSAGGTLAVASTSPLAGGTISVPYSVALQASGGTPAYTWTSTGGTVPPGLTVGTDGTISGTPTTAGTYTATYQVTDSLAATASASLSITIGSALTITTTSLPSGTVNVAYSQVLAAANGTPSYTWGYTAGVLPAGLTLDPDGSLTGTAGKLSGTPTTAGVYPITFQVSDSGGATDTQDITLTISPASGGLPDPGRRVFGGAAGSQAITFVGDTVDRAPGVTFQYYNTFTGGTGTQYTDLTDMGGSPITSVTADSNGFPTQFKGPANVLAMYEDANGGAGPRRLVLCDDFGDLMMAVVSALQGQVGT